MIPCCSRLAAACNVAKAPEQRFTCQEQADGPLDLLQRDPVAVGLLRPRHEKSSKSCARIFSMCSTSTNALPSPFAMLVARRIISARQKEASSSVRVGGPVEIKPWAMKGEQERSYL